MSSIPKEKMKSENLEQVTARKRYSNYNFYSTNFIECQVGKNQIAHKNVCNFAFKQLKSSREVLNKA